MCHPWDFQKEDSSALRQIRSAPPTPCPDMECKGHIVSLVPVLLCDFESRSSHALPLESYIGDTAVSTGMWTCPWAVTGCQARSQLRAGARASEGIDRGPHTSRILPLNVGKVNGNRLGPWAWEGP